MLEELGPRRSWILANLNECTLLVRYDRLEGLAEQQAGLWQVERLLAFCILLEDRMLVYLSINN